METLLWVVHIIVAISVIAMVLLRHGNSLGSELPTFDALYSLQSLVRTVGAQGDGNYNVGRYSNPQMDALVERIKKEVDQKNRNALIEQALLLSHQDVSHIPLHNQVIPWAMKRNIELYHRADNRIDMRGVKVN